MYTFVSVEEQVDLLCPVLFFHALLQTNNVSVEVNRTVKPEHRTENID